MEKHQYIDVLSAFFFLCSDLFALLIIGLQFSKPQMYLTNADLVGLFVC